jgi:predicted lipoprotein
MAWSVRLAAVAFACGASACGGGGDDDGLDARPDDFDRRALLDHLAHDILAPIQADAAAAAAALPAAIDALCDTLDAGADPVATLAAARDAWAGAADAWQLADAVLVGPAAMDNRALRDRIYSFPLLGTCIVDRDTPVVWANPAGFDVAAAQANARSLAAVEYLLFYTDPNHTCPTVPAGWAALGADVTRARCRHAEVLAADVAAQTAAVATAWAPTGGDYAGQLATAGAPGSSIPTAHEGVNRVSDGLFYVDKMVKDMKLGEAAGIVVNSCGAVQMPCLAEVEHRFADRGAQAIGRNLVALERVFTGVAPGTDGVGFDDFLRALGAADVADRMIGELDAAIAAVDALPASYYTALTSDYAAVVAAHTATKAFTDDLKSQFLTVLALEIPDDVATDND